MSINVTFVGFLDDWIFQSTRFLDSYATGKELLFFEGYLFLYLRAGDDVVISQMESFVWLHQMREHKEKF